MISQMAARASLRYELLELGRLARAGCANEHRVALFKTPRNRQSGKSIRAVNAAPDSRFQILLEYCLGIVRGVPIEAFFRVLSPIVGADRIAEYLAAHHDRAAFVSLGQDCRSPAPGKSRRTRRSAARR